MLALLYLVVGAWCGRYCEREESASLLAPAGAVGGRPPSSSSSATSSSSSCWATRCPPRSSWAPVLLPTLALTALLSPPVLLVGRRLLGAPRVVEPYGLSDDASPQPRRGPRGGGGLSAGGWAPALTPRTAVRIAILGGIAMSLLGLLLVRLWFLQVISGEDVRGRGRRATGCARSSPRPPAATSSTATATPLVANTAGRRTWSCHPRDLTGARRDGGAHAPGPQAPPAPAAS